jgi:hypothetical protein
MYWYKYPNLFDCFFILVGYMPNAYGRLTKIYNICTFIYENI